MWHSCNVQVQQRQMNQQSGAENVFQRQENQPSRRVTQQQMPQEGLGREAPAGTSPHAHADPILQEREDFKAAMLAQRFQHMMSKKNAVDSPVFYLAWKITSSNHSSDV